MRRLYRLLSGVATARLVVGKLRDNAVDERYIHALAGDGQCLGELSEEQLAKRTELLPALVSGIIHGGTVGDFAHLVALSVPEAGLLLAGSLVLDSSLARSDIDGLLAKTISGAGCGADFTRLRDRIAGGQVLLMADIADERVDELSRLLGFCSPRALVGGREPRLANHS